MKKKLLSKSVGSKIYYDFKCFRFFELAMTHRSLGEENNERLEFLGDSVLSLVAGNYLYKHFPTYEEGRLSQIKANMIQGPTLCEIAHSLGLKDYIHLDPSGITDKILENACEALIGAIYLDSQSFDQTSVCVMKWYQDAEISYEEISNPKAEIIQMFQAQKKPMPNYKLQKEYGEPHDKHFIVALKIDGVTYLGEGKSIKQAEKAAATLALKALK